MEDFHTPGIKIVEDAYVNTFLYADNQIILQESENALQISVHKLSQIAMEYILKISTKKSKQRRSMVNTPSEKNCNIW
jgi:hypothetical protein